MELSLRSFWIVAETAIYEEFVKRFTLKILYFERSWPLGGLLDLPSAGFSVSEKCENKKIGKYHHHHEHTINISGGKPQTSDLFMRGPWWWLVNPKCLMQISAKVCYVGVFCGLRNFFVRKIGACYFLGGLMGFLSKYDQSLGNFWICLKFSFKGGNIWVQSW